MTACKRARLGKVRDGRAGFRQAGCLLGRARRKCCRQFPPGGAAAKLFLGKAMAGRHRPVLNLDGNPSYPEGVKGVAEGGEAGHRCRRRTCRLITSANKTIGR